MCQFLSFITKGDGNFLFISAEKRQQMITEKHDYSRCLDSHSYIASVFVSDKELKDFNNASDYYGKSDIINKYEIPVKFEINSEAEIIPVISELIIDTISACCNNDTGIVASKYDSFINSAEFKDIVNLHIDLERESILKEAIAKKAREESLEKARQARELKAFDEKITKVTKANIKKLVPKEFRYLINF
jgi:hypothetical protein